MEIHRPHFYHQFGNKVAHSSDRSLQFISDCPLNGWWLLLISVLKSLNIIWDRKWITENFEMYANNLFIPWTSSYVGSVIKMALTEIENPSDKVSKISACFKMSFLLLIITHECLITLNFGVRLNILISSVFLFLTLIVIYFLMPNRVSHSIMAAVNLFPKISFNRQSPGNSVVK